MISRERFRSMSRNPGATPRRGSTSTKLASRLRLRGLVSLVGLVGLIGSSEWLGSVPSVCSVAQAAPGSVRPDRIDHRVDVDVLDAARRGEWQRVIVEITDPLSPDDRAITPGVDEHATREQRGRRRADLDARKARVLDAMRSAKGAARPPRTLHELPHFRLLALEVGPEHLAAILSSSDVMRVHSDRLMQRNTASSVPFTQASVWHASGVTGQSTTVAVLDTPVHWWNGSFGPCAQPGDAGCGISQVVNTFGGDVGELQAHETDSHGSNVAGIVLAMAPETKVVSLNVFHWDERAKAEYSYTTDEAAALDWVAENAEALRIVSVNMSLGDEGAHTPCNGDSLFDPIRTLFRDHDVVTVISAGNESRDNAVSTPACISLAMTVGAQIDTDVADWCGTGTQQGVGDIACFSNLSGMVDITAPGVKITAGGENNLSGTSMAAPHVSGALALLASQRDAHGTPWTALSLSSDLRTLTVPQPRNDLRFDSLRFEEGIAWSLAKPFAFFYRDSTANAIVTGSNAYTDTVVIADAEGTTKGVYLNLELLHKTPEDLRVKLTNPAGVEVEVALPAGLSNYNGTLGRTHQPGAFLPLAGTSPNGTWTLAIRDAGTTGGGHFLRAELYLATEACIPSCGAGACLDDGCGGVCDRCLIEQVCVEKGGHDPSNDCHVCSGSQSTSWEVEGDGSSCDDHDACTRNDSCASGLCSGQPTTCPDIECQVSTACLKSTGVCIYENAPPGTPCSTGQCYLGACALPPSTGGMSGAAGSSGSVAASTSAGGVGGTGENDAPARANDIVPAGGCDCRVSRASVPSPTAPCSDRSSDPSPLPRTPMAGLVLALGVVVARRIRR